MIRYIVRRTFNESHAQFAGQELVILNSSVTPLLDLLNVLGVSGVCAYTVLLHQGYEVGLSEQVGGTSLPRLYL